MQLTHLDFDQLKPCPLNVRKKGHGDIADLLPSVRALGILQPLLVRPDGEGFEVVAGRRRYNALAALRSEGTHDPVPCLVMDDGDDAKALEASLAENIARLPMHEIDQYKAFAALIAKGMSPEDIASHFGVTERLVKQRLAIAGIIEPILNAYRRDDIDAETLRILTMATPRQQKAWWTLLKSEEEYAPTGRRLKEWLFGGAQIPAAHALFDESAYTGAIISNLFGEDRYFADAAAFWPLQNTAIAARRDAYLKAGWSEVIVLDAGERFATWEHEKTTRAKGGNVFIATTHDGEVSFHEGWLSLRESRRAAKVGDLNGSSQQNVRPELTSVMRNYLGLHKHAAVCAELLARPAIALRLTVAHLIAGSGLWVVRADDQRANTLTFKESITSGTADKALQSERIHVSALLGWPSSGDEAMPAITSGCHDLRDVFTRLIRMNDDAVMRVLAYLMAETLRGSLRRDLWPMAPSEAGMEAA